jgi:hypothetical protein
MCFFNVMINGTQYLQLLTLLSFLACSLTLHSPQDLRKRGTHGSDKETKEPHKISMTSKLSLA